MTDKGQTTVPQEIREAMGASPRRRWVWEARPDGSAVVRPMPRVMELAGSLKSEVRYLGVSEETEAATEAWAAESSRSKCR